jgi:sulfotransferase family protein
MISCFHIDNHCEHEKSIFRSVDMRGDVVCTKNPREAVYMSGAMAVNPNLYVIYVLRDPRSVICSKHLKDPSKYYSNLKVWKESETCRRRLEGRQRFLTVKYEDLVDDPNALQEVIMRAFPFLKKKHDFSEYHQVATPSELTERALNGVRPIDSAQKYTWKSCLPRIKSQCEKHGSISDELVSLGYENTDHWEKLLDSVDSINSESILDKEYRSIKSLKIKRRYLSKNCIYMFQCLMNSARVYFGK